MWAVDNHCFSNDRMVQTIYEMEGDVLWTRARLNSIVTDENILAPADSCPMPPQWRSSSNVRCNCRPLINTQLAPSMAFHSLLPQQPEWNPKSSRRSADRLLIRTFAEPCTAGPVALCAHSPQPCESAGTLIGPRCGSRVDHQPERSPRLLMSFSIQRLPRVRDEQGCPLALPVENVKRQAPHFLSR